MTSYEDLERQFAEAREEILDLSKLIEVARKIIDEQLKEKGE